MLWEKNSNFSASFPDPINSYGFCLLWSVKAHWHTEGLLRGLNLSRYVSACGTRAFFYIYWPTGSLPYREYFTRVLAVTVFPFGKLTFGLALVTAPQIYAVGRSGAVPPKVGFGQDCWISCGLGEGCRDRFLVLPKCLLHVFHDIRSPPWERHSCLCSERSFWDNFEDIRQKRSMKMGYSRWCW